MRNHPAHEVGSRNPLDEWQKFQDEASLHLAVRRRHIFHVPVAKSVRASVFRCNNNCVAPRTGKCPKRYDTHGCHPCEATFSRFLWVRTPQVNLSASIRFFYLYLTVE